MNLKNWWDGTLNFLFDTRRHYMRIIDNRDRELGRQCDTIDWLKLELEKVQEGEKKWAGIAAKDVGELREAKDRVAQLETLLEEMTAYASQVDARNVYLADELGANEREYCKLERKLKAANKKLAAYETPQRPALKPRKRKVVAE